MLLLSLQFYGFNSRVLHLLLVLFLLIILKLYIVSSGRILIFLTRNKKVVVFIRFLITYQHIATMHLIFIKFLLSIYFYSYSHYDTHLPSRPLKTTHFLFFCFVFFFLHSLFLNTPSLPSRINIVIRKPKGYRHPYLWWKLMIEEAIKE